MRLTRILGLRPNPALERAKPAFDKPETKAFREAQRKPHMRRAILAFVAVFAVTYVANKYLTGSALVAMTVVNVALVFTLCFSTMANLFIRTGNWTLRLNPWVTCKAEVRPVRIQNHAVLYLVQAKRQEWDSPVLAVVRRKNGANLRPDKKGVLLVAGEFGGPMAFAPRAGAPVFLVRRAWPQFLRRLMWDRAGEAQPQAQSQEHS